MNPKEQEPKRFNLTILGGHEVRRRYLETIGDSELGARIHEVRELRGLSKSKVASITGLARRSLLWIEDGRMRPSRRLVHSLAMALNANTEYLKWGKGTPQDSNEFGIHRLSERQSRILELFSGATDEEIELVRIALEQRRKAQQLEREQTSLQIGITAAKSQFEVSLSAITHPPIIESRGKQ